MFEYFLLATSVISCGVLYYTDAYTITKDFVTLKYEKWRKLNKLVSTTQDNKLLVVVESIKLILQVMYISLLQKMNKSIKKLDKRTYEVTYVINGRMYKMVAKPTPGPIPILQIIDEESNDVTDKVLPYMGPTYDWHGNKLSPEFFGAKTLTFELYNGTEYTFKSSPD
jgi:hypothetical protein